MNENLSRIIESRRRLAAIEHERSRLIAELFEFVDVLVETNTEGKRNRSSAKKGQTLRLSKSWIALLQRLSEFKHFRSGDVMLESQKLWRDEKILRAQTAGSARAQLSTLTKKGIIKRLGGGNYRVTEATKAALAQMKR